MTSLQKRRERLVKVSAKSNRRHSTEIRLLCAIKLMFNKRVYKKNNSKERRMSSPFNDKKLIYELLKLKENSIDKFYDVVYEAMYNNPEAAVDDGADSIKKLEALRRMRVHYETRSEFERCAFIRDLESKIKEKQ